jgi:hypothetical protein
MTMAVSFVHQRSLRRADVMTVMRAATAERLRRRGVDERRLRILPPSAHVADAVPFQREARRRLRLPQDAAIVFCATRFTGPEKWRQGKAEMVLDLLSAVSALHDAASSCS